MKEEILYKVVSVDSDFIKNYPDKITTIFNNGYSGNTYGYYDFKNHRYLVTYISDNFNIDDELYVRDKEIKKLQEIIIKAKDYIANNSISSDQWTDLGFCNFAPTGRIKYKQLSPTKVKELLNILKGGK